MTAACWATLGAALAGVAGAVFGVLDGVISALLYGDPGLVVSYGLYFAVGGAVTGGIMGGFAGFSHEKEPKPQQARSKQRSRPTDSPPANSYPATIGSIPPALAARGISRGLNSRGPGSLPG